MNVDELQTHSKAPCFVVKRPKALQWFHNGRLCKESDEERQAGRFELFLDLLCTSSSSSHAFEDFLADQVTQMSLSSPISAMSSPSILMARISPSISSRSRPHGTSGPICERS